MNREQNQDPTHPTNVSMLARAVPRPEKGCVYARGAYSTAAPRVANTKYITDGDGN